MREMPSEVLDLIKQWEGLSTKAYRDAGDVWTIGYGHTSAAGDPKVTRSMVITPEQAEEILLRDLKQYKKAVCDNVQVPLNDYQFGALVSFCYNIGVDQFKRSTLLKKLNKGLYNEVPYELCRWNKCNGKIIDGLSNRRAAESGLWARGSFVSCNGVVAEKQESTRLSRNLELLSPVIGSLSGLSALTSGDGVVQYAFAFIMISAAIIAIIMLLKRFKDHDR